MTDRPPTPDPVDWSQAEAGRELDAAVAEMVLGWCNAGDDPALQWGVKGPMWTGPDREHWVRLPDFSTDIAAAWAVLDEMVWRVGTANISLNMEDYGRGAGTSVEGAERAVWVTIGEHTAFGPVAWAICQAALAVSRPAAASADASPES